MCFSIPTLRKEFGDINLRHTRYIMEHKVIDAFYKNLCTHVENDKNPCNLSILPCNEPMFKDQYKAYLNKDKLDSQHPSGSVYEVTPARCSDSLLLLVKLRNILNKKMTESGSHDSNVYIYTKAALSEGSCVRKYRAKFCTILSCKVVPIRR